MGKIVTLAIEGMTCEHCVAAVRKALTGVDGVDEVTEVDLQSGSATVTGSSPVQDLVDAVKSAGYQAHVI